MKHKSYKRHRRATEQTALDLSVERNNEADDVSALVKYDNIHVSQSTFLNGKDSQVHRWFRLTPSFGPDLVQEMMERLHVSESGLILDPFAGAGTTLIEAKMAGLSAFGFEVNPLLHFVSTTCLEWDIDPAELMHELDHLGSAVRSAEAIPIEQIRFHGLEIPPIHNPTRWWRPDILVQLLFLHRAISDVEKPSLRRLLMLALAGVLVPDLTNVTLGRLQLHFIDRTEDEIDVWNTYSRRVLQISSDLHALQEVRGNKFGEAFCYHQNALDLDGFKNCNRASAVITSPPYPNRYSYVWNTRPHLYLLGFMNCPKEASDLDRQTIGGTWGTATSELAKGVCSANNQAVSEVVGPVVAEIRNKDNLMANYIMHYFNRLSKQIEEMDNLLTGNASLAYVVGNSRIKGVYVETDVLLGEIIERLGLGYKVFDVHRFRRRHSGVRLYESIIYARK